MKFKTIHYCWFGKNPKPELILKCMKSWKKYCPDYEIIEWNEENFDINCCDYVREAYEAKKWAFVSDYCRFWVLYHHGGIYLDTDVELIKSLDNLDRTFVGFETIKGVNSGLVRGAEKGDMICRKMLESYHNDHFRNNDESLNLMTVCVRETNILCSLGMKLNNKIQKVEKTTIYPSDYFNPINHRTSKLELTSNTVSIHHYAASWVDNKTKLKSKIYSTIYRLFGVNFVEKIKQLIGWKTGKHKD